MVNEAKTSVQGNDTAELAGRQGYIGYSSTRKATRYDAADAIRADETQPTIFRAFSLSRPSASLRRVLDLGLWTLGLGSG